MEPGDKVLVIHAGFFGARIAEMARRAGADLVELTAPLGQIVPLEQVADALAKHPDTKLVGVVHAETSTGVRYPVQELGPADRATAAPRRAAVGGLRHVARRRGGRPCRVGHRLRLLVFAEVARLSSGALAVQRLAARAGADRGSQGARLVLVRHRRCCEKYWVERPITYHHTMPILQYYALYEGIRLALEEGLEARWARHEDAGRYFQQQMRDRGYTFLSDPDHQLWELSAIDVPEGVDGKEIQTRILREFGIEVGGGLGPTAPPIWRVGLMGVNANRETADRVIAAFDAVLPR